MINLQVYIILISACNGFLIFLLVVSPFSFSIGDTTELDPYLHGGIAVQVKTPKTFCFVSMFLFLGFFLLKIYFFAEEWQKRKK